jgi:indole-3-glycerol phosphate synthase
MKDSAPLSAMTSAVPDILAKIAEHKRSELQARLSQLESLMQQADANRGLHRDFAHALKTQVPAIISEIKKASPSKGLLSPDFDPVRIASTYAAGGASALSVLTDERFFQGSLDDLKAARAAVNVPVLRKDFTLEPFHVYEAAANGADAILLIVALLDTDALRDLRELAESLGMAALVEVHDDFELDWAVESGAKIIGVNNRDLRTFEVRLETSLQLAEQMPSGVIAVSESGIHSKEDVKRLQAAGYSAFLVGEHLMKSGDPAQAIRELRQS